MLNIHTCHNYMMSDELCRIIRDVPEERSVYVVVPKQLTLLTEQTIMRGLSIDSSFRIQVYNSTRICKLIFDEAGYPEGEHIDERGRVMLCRRAIHDIRDQLTIYRDAEKRSGFASKCAQQIEIFIQGGVDHEQLRDISKLAHGVDARKFSDLSLIMQRYTELTHLEEKYLDSETELIEATQRVAAAHFPETSCFIFFGFSIVPPTLTNFAAAVASVAADTHMLFSLEDNDHSPDHDCYRPILKTMERLTSACYRSGVPFKKMHTNSDTEGSSILELSHQLYSTHFTPYIGDHSSIHYFTTRTIREECNCVAALARQLAREKGIRYGDMQILCADLLTYRSSLKEAFESYNVPLMYDAGRPVSRVGAAEMLLLALKTVIDGYRLQDITALIRTGYCNITQYDADHLENYAVRYGIEGNLWKRPFNRGNTQASYAEGLRLKLIPPLEQLHDSIKRARTLKSQLTALFTYLSDPNVDALKTSRDQARKLSNNNRNEEAGLISQSWNRLMSTLDMMHDLLGKEALSMIELYRMISGALDASVINVLPQSADSVFVQSTGSLLHQHALVIFAIGLCDRTSGISNTLLLPPQQHLIVEHTNAYLGPGDEDAPLQRRYYLKESLGMASDEIYLSCSMVGFDGASHKCGEELRSLINIFPDIKPIEENYLEAVMLGASEPAFEHTTATYGSDHSANDLLAKASLIKLSNSDTEISDRLNRIESVANSRERKEYADPSNIEQLYQNNTDISVTQLEHFSDCPFSHFIKYGLHPEIVEAFEMTKADAGIFLHGCINEFLKSHKHELNAMTASEAEEKMRKIAELHVSDFDKASYLREDSASVAQEYDDLIDRVCHCARIIALHMKDSLFNVTETEMHFDTPSDDNVRMNGSIDRVDTWNKGNRFRIIDFKSSVKEPDPSTILDGSALQLSIYMGVAKQEMKSECAGMFYFPMLDPYLTNESRNPIELERKRSSDMRLLGILPADPELILAQSQTPENVFRSTFNQDSTCKKGTAAATDSDFRRLISHAQKKVNEHLQAISEGDCRAFPLSFKKKICEYCLHHAACLHDPAIDNKRRLKKVGWEELFTELALHDDFEKASAALDL